MEGWWLRFGRGLQGQLKKNGGLYGPPARWVSRRSARKTRKLGFRGYRLFPVRAGGGCQISTAPATPRGQHVHRSRASPPAPLGFSVKRPRYCRRGPCERPAGITSRPWSISLSRPLWCPLNNCFESFLSGCPPRAAGRWSGHTASDGIRGVPGAAPVAPRTGRPGASCVCIAVATGSARPVRPVRVCQDSNVPHLQLPMVAVPFGFS